MPVEKATGAKLIGGTLVLEQHFPARPGEPNEIPDTIKEI